MAQRQPSHRRPSWAKHEKSYTHYLRTDLARDRSPGDYGMDNFSYDEAHIEQWTIPAHTLERLPDELQKPASEWQFAGAAVSTALERIKRLDDESIYRGYPEPEKSTHPHLSRRVSNAQWPATTVGAGPDTPPTTSPASSTPVSSFTGLPMSMLPHEQVSFNGISKGQTIGMESPPFTPFDSQTCPTPEFPHTAPFTTGGMPDVHALTRQLSPISLRGRVDSRNIQYNPVAFDESAWDVYLNTFRAEMSDLRSSTLPRLKGLGSTVDKLCVEYARDNQFKDAIDEFRVWWIENKGQAVRWEERARMLEVPSLDHMRKERLSMGLPI